MDQCAAQPELLLHAAGQLACRSFGEGAEVGGGQQLGHARPALRAAEAEQGGEELDVLGNRQLGVEIMAQALEHKGDTRIEAGAMLAVGDGAAEYLQLTLLEDFHPGDQSQQAGLAGAIRADQAAAGAGGQAETDFLQGLLLAIAVAQTAGLKRQFAHCRLAGQATPVLRT